MPEAAEVRGLTTTLQGAVDSQIEDAVIMSGRYVRSPIEGLSSLRGQFIEEVECKGKLLYFGMASGQVCLSTLGMTGWWVHLREGERFPKYAQLRLDLKAPDGRLSALVFIDPRNFGTFKVVEYADLERKLSELGPDILVSRDPPAELFKRLAKQGRKPIAECLLDQKIFCGVGNYIRADALYLAQVDPRRKVSTLTEDEVRRVWRASHLVARSALSDLSVLGGPGFFNVCYGRKVDEASRLIESYQDTGGRTVWWCPAHQK